MNIDDMSKRLKSLERKVNQRDQRSIFCSPKLYGLSHFYDCGRPCYYCRFLYFDRKDILTTNTHTLQIEEILELLPHRFPFLLVELRARF